MGIYIGVLSFLAGLCTLHFFLYKFKNKGTNQFLILAVCVCYGLITILKRMVAGTVINAFIAQFISFFLITATFILISIYIATVINKKSYYKQSWIFYITMIVICIIGVYIYIRNKNIDFFYYGLAILSLQYVIFSLLVLISLWNKFDTKIKILLFATYFMIISFVVLALMTIFKIQQVYFCAIGPFVYLFVAEWVSITQKPIIKSVEFTDKEKEIIGILKENQNLEIKEISTKVELSVETTRKYLQRIYKAYNVHSKDELVEVLQTKY